MNFRVNSAILYRAKQQLDTLAGKHWPREAMIEVAAIRTPPGRSKNFRLSREARTPWSST